MFIGWEGFSKTFNFPPNSTQKGLDAENNKLKVKTMGNLNLKFLNTALGKVSTDEFAVLYIIANNPKLKKEGRARIHREVIADLLGWLNDKRPEYALKKVTRITNSLVEKGWIKKDIVYESTQKSVIYYSLCTQKIDEKLGTSTQKIDEKLGTSTQKIDEKLGTSTQKSVPLNNSRQNKTKEDNRQQEETREVELAIACGNSTEEVDAPLPF